MVQQPSLQADANVLVGQQFFDIVEDAYRLFSFPKPPNLKLCDCWMPSQVEKNVLSVPIRALPLGHIRDWYIAECEHYRVSRAIWGYLLPRILEILASGNLVSEVSLELSLRRFATGNPDNWNKEQWAMLDRFQRLFLKRMMDGSEQNSYFLKNHRLDDVLCMFRLAGWRLESLLQQVVDTPDEILARRLWSDWCEGYPAGRQTVVLSPFWEAHDTPDILSFYTSDNLQTRMEMLALGNGIDAALAEKASAVVSAIEISRG